MKTNHLIRQLAVVLVALLAEASPTWAAWEHDETITDDGGGTYRFLYDTEGDSNNADWFNINKGFKTLQSFDLSNDFFFWNFEIHVFDVFTAIYSISSPGDVYVATYDSTNPNGIDHKIGTFTFKRGKLTYSEIDNSYGLIRMEWKDLLPLSMNLLFLPFDKCISEKVTKIKIRFWPSTSLRSYGSMQYEKDLDFSSLSEDKPMPKLSIDWNENGELAFTANNVKDKRDSWDLGTQGYEADCYFCYAPMKVTKRMPLEFYTGRYNVTDNQDGTINLTNSYWYHYSPDYQTDGAYTTPVHVFYHGRTKVKCWDDKLKHWTQPGVWEVVKPFTRPSEMKVEFDKWNKKNVVKWTRTTQAKGYNSSQIVMVDCRYDGQWYVIRYKKGQQPADYTLIGSINGQETTLQIEDNNIEFGEEYIYRVVFLPNILVGKYKEKLTQLPGQSSSHTNADLWEEISVNTTVETPVVLSQDRTDESGIHLKWEYCVKPTDCELRIDKHRLGNNTWNTVTTLNVDPDQTNGDYIEEGGSVCDFYVYRLMMKIRDMEFYSDTLVCNLPGGAYISDLQATTGTDEKTVIVKWKVARPGNDDICFRILRRPIGSDEWTLLSDDMHGTATEYTYIDDRVMAGSYYDYGVEAYGAKCDEQLVQTDRRVAPGFSQARGTITGHIAYGTGTAVSGVRVNLVKSTVDQSADTPQYLSRFIDGEGKGLQWTADSTKYARVLNGNSELTLQFWADPQTDTGAAQKTLLVLNNALELGVKTDNGTDYYLYAVDGTNSSKEVVGFTNLVFDSYDFTHVAAAYSKGTWTFYVGKDTLLTATMTVSNKEWNAFETTGGSDTPTLSLGGSNHIAATTTFTGFVDDMRLWNRSLSRKEISDNYTRILGGIEDGLILYWPFDEGLNVLHYVFDVACQDGIYQLNHPTVGVNAVPKAKVPKLLKLYGMTDAEGDYIIRGIPFHQGGTTYKLAPELGIHNFNPNSRSMFISPTSLTANNIDFEDVSSFPMEGHIYYAGTNIPAEGIQFYVDGDLVTAGGEVKTTDANGYYQISVPIGQHFVEAKLDGHTMVDGGRFPTKGTYNFDRAVQYDFADSTLVNFVGRIGGGVRNDTLAVGFGASKNNIGIATVTLKLNNESFSFNCQDDHISDATANRSWESDTTSIASRAWTGIGANSKYIFIRTDSLTGEFSALLPPLNYITKSIRVDKNPDVEFTTLPQVDLTNVRKELSDSLKQPTANGDTLWNYYKYNTKMVQSYFAKPKVSLWQVGGDGAFGEQELKDYAVSSTEKMDITGIWTRTSDGTVNYTYEYPIFARKKKYVFGVQGYEVYTNYDKGKAVPDTIPMNGQVLTIANEMSDEQDVVSNVIDPTLTDLKPGDIYNLKRNQVRLDKEGKNKITFNTGAPNITAPYTRQFGITFERNNRTYVEPAVNGIVLGEITNGNNFVTDGPDHVDMVLRDPPGSKGKTTWKTGTSYTTFTSSTDGLYWDQTMALDLIWGADLETAVGLGVAIISGSKATTTMVAGEKSSISWLWKDESTYVYTTADNIATSTGSKYVGANGDVFIGKSHNFIVGTCRKLGFHREADGIKLGLKEAVTINDSIKTDFIYSALEISETMIPKILDTRNALLEYADSTTAVNYKNNSPNDVYLTWLKPDNPQYGQEKTYVWKPGKNGKSQNMVLHYNESVRLWKERLAENEKDKVEATQNPDYYKENRSFDGGTSYAYTERRDTTLSSTYQQNNKVGVIYELKTELAVNAAATFGSNFNFKTEIGYTGNLITGDSLDNVKSYAEFDYELNDGNPGTDFTVDIYKSPRGWSDIFILRGGQSYNPYEGLEYAQYYEPEKKHVISYGTEQMEQPAIAISTDGAVGAKSAHLTDVPAGQMGQFTLHLSNNNATNQPFDFTYNLSFQEHTDSLGLEVFMDGVPVDGRSVWVPAGETVKKIITVRQTDQSQLDYEGIKLRFTSQYQPLKIYDEVSFDVHFKPSSSPIDLVINDPVLNIETLERNNGNLEMKVTNFDRQFKGMKKLGVEYRYEGATQWTQPPGLTFLVNRADSTNANDQVLPVEGDLRLTYDMKDDNYYPQGTYTFRAYTTTMYGTEPVNVYSGEVTVVKDNVSPRQLTTPTPTNGILGYGDDMTVEFNENIVPGYVSDKNIIVTAELNHQPVDHQVGKLLMPAGEEQRTVNPIFANGNFSFDFWMLWNQAGSILQLGKDWFTLSVDDSGHIVAKILGEEFVSHDVVPSETWTYVVFSFDASDMDFSALAQYDTQTLRLFTDEEVDPTLMQNVGYTDNHYLYLGNMTGVLHDLCLYNIYRDPDEASATKYQTKDGYVYGLMNYWAMDEGHGRVAADSRHTHDFEVNDLWYLDNDNLALQLSDEEGVHADISRIHTASGDSYAIEMWVQGGLATDTEQTVFETGSEERNHLRLYYDSDLDLMLKYGDKLQTVAAHDEFPGFHDWNHVALNVVRGQAASFYYNGQRTAVISELDVPPIDGSYLKLGEGMGQESRIDEVRVWHASLSESRLLANHYNCMDTTDVYSRGLVAYYPFEKDGTVDGVDTKIETLENMARESAGFDGITLVDGSEGDLLDWIVRISPPLKKAPKETRLSVTPVASDRKVVINLNESGAIAPQELEGSTLNITVDKIHDMHGNESAPIRWTAFVQKNALKWTKDSVTVIKQYGDDYTFDVDIVNKSGTTEYYTLYNMPEWLTLVNALDGTLVDESGNIAPLSQKTLRFRVDPFVRVGNFDVTIGLQGNDEIMEPLRIVMKVRGQMPAWSVDPSKYENTMSIVGQVYVNGILMGNSESRIAAFIGDECRGIASPEQIRGGAYVAMTVYGTAQQEVNGVMTDLDKGKALSFRIWDAATGVAYTSVNVTIPNADGEMPPTNDIVEGSLQYSTLIFDPVKSYGTFNAPVIFTKGNQVEQGLTLTTGWNWLSLGVEPSDKQPSVVFKSLSSWNVRIKDRNTGTVYCNGTNWAGNLTDIHANTMYKMLLNRLSKSKDYPTPLPVSGVQVKLSDTPVTLNEGWNWIAYLPTTTMTLDKALAGANPQEGDQVKSQTGFAYYGPYGWEGNLKVLESGKGYLYYSQEAKQFIYPTVSDPENGSHHAPLATMANGASNTCSPVDPTTYPDNMSMVIQLIEGGEAVTTAEVAAFVEGECRGAASAIDGLYYLLITGEGSGQPMEIRACTDDGSIVTVCNTLTFSSDANIGTPWEPFVIDIGSPTGLLFNGGLFEDGVWYTLQGMRYGTTKPKQSGVYLYNGQKVVIK